MPSHPIANGENKKGKRVFMQYIGTLEVEHESVLVAHDPHTGAIVHMHYVVTMKGGTHPDQQTIERDALEQLSEAQPGIARQVTLLHVDPKSIKPRTRYKVDVQKRLLVEIPHRQ